MTDPIHDTMAQIIPPGGCLIVSDDGQEITLCKPSDVADNTYLSSPPDKPFKVIHKGPNDDWQNRAKLWRQKKSINETESRETQIIGERPETQAAQVLYDLASQVEDLKISINIQLPIKLPKLSNKTHEVHLKALIENKGALVYLGSSIEPAISVPLWEPGTKIPILSPFFKVKLMQLSLDDDRHVQARVCYLIVPFNYDVHDKVIEQIKKNGIPQELLKKQGYDWNQKVPLYTWEIVDSLLNFAESIDKDKTNALGAITPLWDKGLIEVKGSFSNKRIELAGMMFDFKTESKKQSQGFNISGSITNPTLTIHGLSDVTFGANAGFLHFSNTQPYDYPWIIKTKWDPSGQKKPVFTIPQFRSDNIFLETKVINGKEKYARLDMQEGIEMTNVVVDMNEDIPTLSIDRIVAKQIAIDGFGTKLNTEKGNQAIVENLKLSLDKAKPHFQADIRSKAKGEISYFMNREELGKMSFDFIDEATGHINIGADENGDSKVTIAGRIKSRLPNLRLLVRSEKMHAFVKTQIDNAFVNGEGSLSIWPQKSEIEVASQQNKPSVHVEGTQGEVVFGQNASQVSDWKDELATLLPAELLGAAKTEIRLALTNIRFDVQKMKLKSVVARSDGKPAFQIEDTIMSPIFVEGILQKGLFFLRLPTGLYASWDLLTNWNLNNSNKPRKKQDAPLEANARIEIKLQQLSDNSTATNISRKISFDDLSILIEEMKDTFSAKDKARCGSSKQHIHASLDKFFFDPNKREFSINGLKHLHVVLRNPFGKNYTGSSGCIVVK